MGELKMNYFKLGCNWGSGAPDFYDLLLKQSVVICGNIDMEEGDYVAICKGFKVFAVAVLKSSSFPVTDRADLKTDFNRYKITYAKTNKIAAAVIYELTEDEQFGYELQQGICKVNKEDIKNKIKKFIDIKGAHAMNDKKIKQYTNVLKMKKNIILQGAPGTGKTYCTAALAVYLIEGGESTYTNHAEIMKKYDEYIEQKQIQFTTFHQSMDYEDFVEGIKPEILDSLDGSNTLISYKVKDGIFKEMCKAANENYYNSKKTVEQLKSDRMIQNIQNYLNESDIFATIYNSIIDDIRSGTITSYQFANSKSIPITWDEERQRIIFREQSPRTEKEDNIKLLFNYFISNNINNISSYDKEQWWNLISSLTHGKTKTIDYIEYGWILNELITRFNNREYKNDLQNINDAISERVTEKPYVLIIDEINRGNVSKIFGELITVLEADKRSGADHPITVTLPYSNEQFSVPPNLYIIGTMNTTDRSVGTLDYAIRRRFAFITLTSSYTKNAEGKVIGCEELNEYYAGKSGEVKTAADILFANVYALLSDETYKVDMDINDLMVGHSYFMATSLEELELKLEYEIKPLIREYAKDGIISIDESDLENKLKAWTVK